MKKIIFLVPFLLLLLTSCEQITNKTALERLQNENTSLIADNNDLKEELELLKEKTRDNQIIKECNELFSSKKDSIIINNDLIEYRKEPGGVISYGYRSFEYERTEKASFLEEIFVGSNDSCYVAYAVVDTISLETSKKQQYERSGYTFKESGDFSTGLLTEFNIENLYTGKKETYTNLQDMENGIYLLK